MFKAAKHQDEIQRGSLDSFLFLRDEYMVNYFLFTFAFDTFECKVGCCVHAFVYWKDVQKKNDDLVSYKKCKLFNIAINGDSKTMSCQ